MNVALFCVEGPYVAFDANRVIPLGVALAEVLEGADLKTTKRAAAIKAFFDAFEEGMYLINRFTMFSRQFCIVLY